MEIYKPLLCLRRAMPDFREAGAVSCLPIVRYDATELALSAGDIMELACPTSKPLVFVPYLENGRALDICARNSGMLIEGGQAPPYADHNRVDSYSCMPSHDLFTYLPECVSWLANDD